MGESIVEREREEARDDREARDDEVDIEGLRYSAMSSSGGLSAKWEPSLGGSCGE